MMTDLETIYATRPDDSDDSWRTDHSQADPLMVEREWDAMMKWERVKRPERREDDDGR